MPQCYSNMLHKIPLVKQLTTGAEAKSRLESKCFQNFFALNLEESLSGAFFHAKMTFLTIVAFPERSFSKEKIGTRKNRSNNYVFLLETSEIIRSSINIANPACLVRSSTKKIWRKRKIWLMLVLWRDSKS